MNEVFRLQNADALIADEDKYLPKWVSLWGIFFCVCCPVALTKKWKLLFNISGKQFFQRGQNLYLLSLKRGRSGGREFVVWGILFRSTSRRTHSYTNSRAIQSSSCLNDNGFPSATPSGQLMPLWFINKGYAWVGGPDQSKSMIATLSPVIKINTTVPTK